MTFVDGIKFHDEEIIKIQKDVTKRLIECNQQFISFVQDEIQQLGFSYEVINNQNVVAWLDTGRVGCSVALRVLIESEYEVKTNVNCITLLTLMNLMKQSEKEVKGIYYFCFEVKEDAWGRKNAQAILDYLDNRKVAAVLGFHLSDELEIKKVCFDSGVRLAGACKTTAIISNQKVGNPQLAAGHILVNLGSVMLNEFDLNERVSCKHTTIRKEMKSMEHVDEVKLISDIYFYDERVGRKALDLIRNVSEHTAAMYDCCVAFCDDPRQLLPPVVANEVLNQWIKERLLEWLPQESFVSSTWECCPEPFGLYAKRYPCVYPFIGFNKNGKDKLAAHQDTTLIGVKIALCYCLCFIQWSDNYK